MRAALLLTLVAGCIETQHLETPDIDSSHVEVREIPGTRVPKLDVLIVIDDAPGLAAYRDRLAEIPPLIASTLDHNDQGWTDLHIGVTFGDGWMRHLPGMAETYLARSIDFAYTRDQSFDGTLPDALARLIATDTYAGPSQPLAAMEHALETSGQFVRNDADLAVILIGADDDASPLGVADYASWIRALVGTQWHKRVFVSGLYAQPAPRLDAFFATLRATNSGMTTSIDASDYRPAFASLGTSSGWWGGEPCFDAAPVDVDPERPGAQYDCALSVVIDDELRTVPGCDGSAPDSAQMPGPPCFLLASDPQNCTIGDHLVLKLHGYTDTVHPAYRLECRTR